jgi:hypothetical protein
MYVSGDLATFGKTNSSSFSSSADGYTVKKADNDKATIGYKSNGSFGLYTTSSKPMNIDYNAANQIQLSNDETIINKPIVHNNISSGVIIEKKNGNSSRDRYGIAKENENIFIYGPEPSSGPSSTVNMGFIRNNGDFDSILKAKNNGDVVVKNRMCINTTCIDEPDLNRLKNPVPQTRQTQLCLDDVCLSKRDLRNLKNMI